MSITSKIGSKEVQAKARAAREQLLYIKIANLPKPLTDQQLNARSESYQTFYKQAIKELKTDAGKQKLKALQRKYSRRLKQQQNEASLFRGSVIKYIKTHFINAKLGTQVYSTFGVPESTVLYIQSKVLDKVMNEVTKQALANCKKRKGKHLQEKDIDKIKFSFKI